VDPDAAAHELGRHYVAGHIEAEDLDRRLTALYETSDLAAVLADLPALEPTHIPEPRRTGWWRLRHAESDVPNPDWLPTTERFVDPTTQRVMRVWIEPVGRGRHYVPEPA
jgi:hypothetical protein